MSKVLIISGSPQKKGNTASLIEWFCEGARAGHAETEVVWACDLPVKTFGCNSCRACQKLKEYGCIIKDGISETVRKMITADGIVMATPLYFYSASAQLKAVFDRMFSLYKWDNAANTMETVLKGKTFALLASAYEDVGINALKAPFKITADYSGMKFMSLCVKNAGVSGDIGTKPGVQRRATAFGRKVARGIQKEHS